jgi:hypothetical protein
VLAALPALAKPNFTGDWKLNSSKSTFGDVPGPDSMTIKVTHADPKITNVAKQSGQMGEIEIKTVCTTDGKECTNEGFQGSSTKSVMKWDGDVLAVETAGKFGEMDFTMKQKWSLSGDGKTLTLAQNISTAMGDFTQTLVFDKQ